MSPDFLIEEIYNKLDYISEKSGLSKTELEVIFFEDIKLLKKEKYEDKLEESKKICKDIKDVPYIALALKFNCGI